MSTQDPKATAEHMLRTYKNTQYSAIERARDHAISYPSTHPNYKFWINVVAEIRNLTTQKR